MGFWGQRISRAARYFEDKPLWISCLVIFVVCAGIRVALIIVTQQYENFEYPEPIKIAHSIAKTGVFGNPFRVPTGPTAHTPPLVPFLLSLIYRFLSPGEHTELAQEFLSTAVCSLQYALLPVAATVFGWPARVGIFAGLFGALIPFRFWLETKGTFEQVYAGLALLLVTMMTAKAWRSGRLGIASAILQGTAWAVVLHISASFLPVCLAMVAVYAVVCWPRGIAAYVRSLVVMGATMFILLVPWTLRNYNQFGKIFFMRDNLGLELAVSNSDDASPLFEQNIQTPSYRHPHGSRAEALKVLEMGEIAYNQERMQEARAWIKAHPSRFVQLTIERVFYFWFPPMQRVWQTTIYALSTILGFAGAWAAVRRKQMAVWLILSIWLTFPVIYYVIESYARYRYPMDWTFLLMASYGLVVWTIDENSADQPQWLTSQAPNMKIPSLVKVSAGVGLVAMLILMAGQSRVTRKAAASGGNSIEESDEHERGINRVSAVELDAALKDFQTRCQAEGVLKCVGFDDDSWFQQGVYLSWAWDKVYRGTRDTTTKTSGDSSLRFEFPGHSPANGAGSWSMEFGRGFAEHSSFFVQYRMRLNDVMVKTDWDKLVGSSWKQSIFHSKGATCASIEITTGRYSWNGVNGFPVMYSECGGRGMSTNKGDPPSKFEQGGYNCWYSQFNAKDCFFYPADVWLTFYYSISIGDWGKPNSYIQAWVAPAGKSLKKWIDMPNFILNKDNDSSNYNSITLLPYMTAKKMSADHAPGYMWFDEVIVSEKPIAAPAGQAP